MDNRIKQLRTFFRVSNAAFSIIMSFDTEKKRTKGFTKMVELHKVALEEIEKESPDLILIDKLLSEMETQAELNSQPKPNFPKGGISHRSST